MELWAIKDNETGEFCGRGQKISKHIGKVVLYETKESARFNMKYDNYDKKTIVKVEVEIKELIE